MRNILRFLLVFLLIGSFVSSCRKSALPIDTNEPPPPPPDTQPPLETEPALLIPVTENISPNIKGYYSALPARYEESTQKYPVILFMHGGGQYGNGASDLSKILLEGIPKLLNEKKFPPYFTVNERRHSFIVIAPQLVKQVDNTEIETLVNNILDKYRIDASRIYLVGFSLGARELSDYAAYKPSQVAAVISMGGMPQIDKNLAPKCQAMAAAALPVWHFHNRDDSAWYYSEAKRYIQVLNESNPSVAPRFTTFEIGEARLHHDCWTRATNPEYREDGRSIYEWMLNHKR